jgi:hypothetical protein
MKKVMLLLVLFVAVMSVVVAKAQTRTVSWSPVTTYTDGSTIEPGNTVTYSIWRQDGVTLAIVQLANRISSVSTTFDDSTLTKGRTYNFWAQAQLASGASSDNSATYAWVLPLGKAATPAGLAVQ